MMNSNRINLTVDLLLRFALGGLFIWASIDKALDPHLFARMIRNYQVLPLLLVNPTALLIPWLEMLTGLLLITGFWRKSSLFIINSLLVLFILIMAQALLRGLSLDCGCYSTQSGSTQVTWWKVLEDVGMLAAGIWLWIKEPLNPQKT
jgi:uncharacterized membrane protein YphA (DoxX/SURF4 family)